MARVIRVCAYLALMATAGWGGYLWGWYRGLTYHSVLSSMSDAKASLAAARSIRQANPELALELLDADISWADMALRESAESVPHDQLGNYDIVMRQLQDYSDEFGAPATPVVLPVEGQ